MQFRKDINGLRAIAVIAVVLFHFNAPWMPGGFAGVDVFFVISGFLMTGIIFRGIDGNKFTLLRFYLARADRIVPALAVLCFVMLVFGWFYLIAFDFQLLSKHVVSSISFISNITYWQESGYFDVASQEKWLLHTWSLSAEWQFYIIYPLLLIAMRKFMPIKKMKVTVLCCTVLGFIAGVIITYTWSDAAYFLLPARAWEMLLGGVAYLYPLNIEESKRKLHEWFGLSLILGSYLFISKDNLWPGYLAFIPVMGTFIVIQAKRNDSVFTGNIIFQKIGTWSYSIYLWHWPVVVLGYYFEFKNWAYIGIPISIFLGWLSFKYIESMKRDILLTWKKLPSIFAVGCFLFVGIIGAISYSYISYEIENDPKRTDAFIIGHNYYEKSHLKFNNAKEVTYFNGATDNNADFIFIGDSHSAHYSYGISVGKLKIVHIWQSSCLGFIDYTTKPYASWMDEKWKRKCANLYKSVDINKEIPVIIAQNWGIREVICISEKCLLSDKTYTELIENQLQKLFSYIGDRKIFIIGQVPAPQKSMILCTKKRINSCDETTTEFNGNTVKMNTFLNKISNHNSNVYFINPFQAVCTDGNSCQTIINGKNIFFDNGHLSAYGSEKIWLYIEKILNNQPEPVS